MLRSSPKVLSNYWRLSPHGHGHGRLLSSSNKDLHVHIAHTYRSGMNKNNRRRLNSSSNPASQNRIPEQPHIHHQQTLITETPLQTAGEQQQHGQHNNDFYFLGILLYRLAITYGGIFYTSEYVFRFTQCDGPSMLPTMNPVGEIIFIDRLTPRLYGIQGGSTAQDRIQYAQERQKEHSNPDEWHQPFIPVNGLPEKGKWKRFFQTLQSGISVGDVVVVEHPRRQGTVCKRVIGLPGDEIILKQSQYGASHFVGQQTSKLPAAVRKSLQKVPDGHVWLEGDNSANSLDSRTYGTVPAAMIVGRVPFRVWPLRGSAILERGMRPKPQKPSDPKWGSQGSTVLPAGYEGQRIVKEYRDR